jgi:molybdopterin molybdotransferase
MISFEKAGALIEGISQPMKTERVDLLNSLYRVLAEDIHSDTSIPPFDKSAMDGYACRKTDLINNLEVIEEIPAGKVPVRVIATNQCARIMTGGRVPEGADFVIQLEHIEEIRPGYICCIKESSNSNICFTGEDIQKDELVIRKDELITPQLVAILAMAGISHPMVYAIPSVAVISTGNELVEPDEMPGNSKIRNSNAWQIMAQTTSLGYRPAYLGIVPDSEELLSDLLFKAIREFDIVLISGGVSVGDYDFVPKVLRQLGVEIIFHGLDAKPGRHMLFGRKGKKVVFGLPGNPVSSFVQFELLIKPLLLKFKGISGKQEIRQISLKHDYLRKKADTISFIPGNYTVEGTVIPLEYHGSAHIHAFREANCIIEIPKGIIMLSKGDLVNVRSL